MRLCSRAESVPDSMYTARSRCPRSHPLRRAPNVVLTPHLGYCVEETWQEYYPQSVENALAFLDGKPVRVVNPEVL